ncbi:MAG: hypothetical protein NTZ09_00415 [Candidatus Hydrogenedentes bacterium]|nr:hypothetical protein [Candidatus Hydrogenedentota bacterium]
MPKVTIASYSNEAEAELAAGRLACDDIKAEVHRFSRYRAMGAGGYQLRVEGADLAAARRILAGIDGEIDMDEYVDADDASYRRCPKCNSVNVTAGPRPLAMVLASVLLLGLPLLFVPRNWSCRKCGQAWRA